MSQDQTQIMFEDVEVGDGPPSTTHNATTQQLVQYAAVSGDFTPIHYDKDYAQAAGHEHGVILHGALKSSIIAHFLTQWIGEKGSIASLEASYRAVDYPGEPMTCTAKVTRKYIQDGRGTLDLDVEIRNPQGIVTTPGKATVSLPMKR